VGSEGEELLPEALLDLSEVGRQPSEGGSVHFAEGGEPLCIVPSEVVVDGFVGVHAEELSDYLDGEDLGVGELGRSLRPSSTRQKTEMMKVLRSTREDLPYAGWFGRCRA
jgi:hypothetical protein